MKKTYTIMKIIVVTLIALAIGAAQARAAVTVYADDMVSNATVAASAPLVETKVPAVQTNLNVKSRPAGENPNVRIDETGVHIGGPNGVDIQTPRGTLEHAVAGRSLVSIVAIICTFGMPVAIIALAGYFMHRRNRLAHETIRAMIEKGAPVTPELVAELRNRHPYGSTDLHRPRGGRLLPGLVMAGIGTALLVSGSGGDRKGGWIVLFIGLAFLVVWAVERKNQNNAQPPQR